MATTPVNVTTVTGVVRVYTVEPQTFAFGTGAGGGGQQPAPGAMDFSSPTNSGLIAALRWL